MSLQPVDLLKFAKSLPCDNEASCRAAVSRAYYCAYHRVRPLAERMPATRTYALPGPVRHQEIADRLFEWKIPSEWATAVAKAGDPKAFARDYKAALAQRKMADYNLRGVVSSNDAQLQIERCSDINQFVVRFETALAAAAA